MKNLHLGCSLSCKYVSLSTSLRLYLESKRHLALWNKSGINLTWYQILCYIYAFNTENNTATTRSLELDLKVQKQPPEVFLRSSGVLTCSEKMQWIYRRAPMPKCDFNKVARPLNILFNASKNINKSLVFWCY